MDEAVADQRDVHFAEELVEIVRAARWLSRVEAGDVARSQVGVGRNFTGLAAPFSAQRDANAACPKVEKITVGDDGAGDLGRVRLEVRRPNREVVGRLLAQVAQSEDVGRNAAGCTRGGIGAD